MVFNLKGNPFDKVYENTFFEAGDDQNFDGSVQFVVCGFGKNIIIKGYCQFVSCDIVSDGKVTINGGRAHIINSHIGGELEAINGAEVILQEEEISNSAEINDDSSSTVSYL